MVRSPVLSWKLRHNSGLKVVLQFRAGSHVPVLVRNWAGIFDTVLELKM